METFKEYIDYWNYIDKIPNLNKRRETQQFLIDGDLRRVLRTLHFYGIFPQKTKEKESPLPSYPPPPKIDKIDSPIIPFTPVSDLYR